MIILEEVLHDTRASVQNYAAQKSPLNDRMREAADGGGTTINGRIRLFPQPAISTYKTEASRAKV